MPERADLLVVGAGCIGGWAATLAAREGAGRVVVLDAERAGWGASPRAAGIVRAQGGTPTAVELAQWSIAFYERQREELGIDSAFRRLGYLILAFGPEDEAAARERLAMQAGCGLPSRRLSPEEAARLNPLLDPSAISGATYCELDGAIDPPRNVTAYVTAMRAAGAELREGVRVTALRLQDGRVRGVETGAGAFEAERVLLAGGWGQRALSAMAGGRGVPIGAVRHQVAVTGPHPRLAGAPLPMGFDLGAGLYWRQEEDGLLFGMSNPAEAPGEATAIDWRMLEEIRARLGTLLPLTRELELRRLWAATIDYSPDHLPILGPALDAAGEPVEGLWLASASGHGMMWGPGVARAAVDLALRGATEVTDTSFLGADRFDDAGRSTLQTDPIALPFPEAAEG